MATPVHTSDAARWRSGNALDLLPRGNGSNLGQNTSHPWAFRGFPLLLETTDNIVSTFKQTTITSFQIPIYTT